MGLFNFLFKKNEDTAAKEAELVEAFVCPNCWGHQNYDEQFVQYVEDRQKDIINKDASAQKAFIAKFVEERITGIRLKKEGDKLSCQKCKGGYKMVSSNLS